MRPSHKANGKQQWLLVRCGTRHYTPKSLVATSLGLRIGDFQEHDISLQAGGI
jgi:hypothetical protein